MGTLGVGRCKSGNALCVNGNWSQICNGDLVTVAREACGNKVDDTCDGQTDEGSKPVYGGNVTGDKV